MTPDDDPRDAPESPRKWKFSRVALGFLGAAALGVALYASLQPPAEQPPEAPTTLPTRSLSEISEGAQAWRGLSRREDSILRLDENLADLAFSIRNLEFPDARTRQHFLPFGLTVEDIGEAPARPQYELEGIGSTVSVSRPGNLQRDLLSNRLRMWRPLLDEIESFDFAELKIRRGRFLEGPREEFEADVAFRARAQMRSGKVVSLSAEPRIRWRLIAGTDPKKREYWTIVDWRTGAMTWIDAAKPLFREVLAEALPSEDALRRARTSLHERMVAADILSRRGGGDFEAPHEFFAHTAVFQHPGLAVVDIDRDGFDDFYVTTRWDRNQFFRNLGNGSFEEISAELGLDVDSYSNSALFADFDNDGDSDLFLSRSLEPSIYLVNESGRFVDRSAEYFEGKPPAMLSSASAADYDGDGLLDLYAATYAVQLPLEDVQKLASPSDYARFSNSLRTREGSAFLFLPGPPNILFKNTGSGFERVATTTPIAVLRNTYQATWSDFDGDGDPDLYLANDFAPDNLIRNDGEGHFSDVTTEMGISLSGFGMGATWGDYDRDGRQDLYVANMYSKAGTRVTESLDYLHPGFNQAAQGNYLYHNEADGFRLVSGNGESDLHVNRAGWAWGTHFLDADNDGYLDLFALAGFYTAPREVEKAGDS